MVAFAASPSWMFKVELSRHFPFLSGGESMNDQAQFFVGWGTLSLDGSGFSIKVDSR